MASTDWVVKPALCLDLDGTIRFNRNDPKGFINKPDDIAIYEDVEKTLWEWRDKGYLIFALSNQGGVAFGYKTFQSCDAEVEATVNAFERNPFHSIQSCCHHEGGKVEPYNHRSLFRKPRYGMLAVMEVEAFDEGYIVDWDNSIMVGDREEDMRLAENADIDFIWAHQFFGRNIA